MLDRIAQARFIEAIPWETETLGRREKKPDKLLHFDVNMYSNILRK